MSQMHYSWQKRWAYERAHGLTRYIDPAPAVAHLRALLAAGASRRAIADKAGVTPVVITNLLAGQRNVRRTTAAAILAVRPADIFARSGGDDFVPAVGTRRRVQALMAIGHPAAHIATAMGPGITAHTVHNLSNQKGPWVSRANHQRIAAAYDRLWDKPGTSRQTRGAAKRLGYAGPLAWDDDTIDDPAATPDLGEPSEDATDVDEARIWRALSGEQIQLSKPERVEVVRQIAAQGLSDTTIAQRLGVTDRTIARDRAEFAIPSRWVA